MPITVTELVKSRTGAEDSRTLYFKADGSSDDAAIIAAVLAEAPSTHNGLPRSRVISTDNISGDRWEVGVLYGNDATGSSSTEEFGNLLSWSTTGATKRVTQSTRWIANYSATGEPAQPVLNGVIGDSESGPEGTNWPAPTFNFAIRKRFAAGAVTAAYIRTLFTLTSCVNDGDWSVTVNYGSSTLTLSFTASEVVFLGADQPEPQADGTVAITFNFNASPTLNDFVVSDNFDPITKRGQDYIWFRYQKDVIEIDGPDNTAEVNRAVGLYVEQIGVEANFNALNL